MRTQFGRSMIEMLGVLAIIGVLSIGGIALYRRAVNNHHANTILDDVNRFAFVITEKGGYPEGEDIPKGDFKESGIYQLKGHQAYGGQYSITALNVPKGVCEILIDKGIIDYKVGVVTAGGNVENEILYDTLHTDICTHDLNDVAFYFGDVSGVCNTDENEDTACTQNSDCCGGTFCAFQNPGECERGDGICLSVDVFGPETKTITVNGVQSEWLHSTRKYENKYITWWSAQNWCQAQGKQLAKRGDLGCGHVSNGKTCTISTSPGGTDKGTAYNGSALYFLQTSPSPLWIYGSHWLDEYGNDCAAHVMHMDLSLIGGTLRSASGAALCH